MSAIKSTLPGAILMFLFVNHADVRADWTGGLEGGTVIRNGESISRIRLHANQNTRPLSHHLYAEWYRDDDNTLELGYRPRYWLGEKLYTFGETRLRFDEAFGIDRETQVLAGLGIQLLATRVQQFNVEVGAGYQLTRYTEETMLDDTQEEVGVLRGNGSQILSDLFKLDVLAEVFASPKQVQSQVELGGSMRLPQGAIRLSYRVWRVDIDGLEAIDDADTAISFTIGF